MLTRGDRKIIQEDIERFRDCCDLATRIMVRHCVALLAELEREKEAHRQTIRMAGVHLAKVP